MLNMKQVLSIFFLSMFTVLQVFHATKIGITAVYSKYGTIVGTRSLFNNIIVDEYLGIPFAKSPVGNLRFKRTEPISSGFRFPFNLMQLPPACPQFEVNPSPFSVNNTQNQSEDCLYLNIWAPGTPSTKKRAVMHWIHGGFFAVGGSRIEIYNGKALSAMGDVVVVSVNYRLNVLGFFYSGSDDAPGNAAVYDALVGLKWTKNNIASFGGDPDSITLFGQSAGSIITGTLAVSPLAKGLFKRVIMESGASTYLEGNNITRNAMLSQEVANAMKCADNTNTLANNPSKVVSCLRKADAHELAKTTALLYPHIERIFQPQFGDDIVPKNTRQAVIDGDFYNVDLLIGDTADEGSESLILGQPKIFGYYGEKNTLFNKSYARHRLHEIMDSNLLELGNIQPIIDHYLGSVPDDNYEQIRKQTYTALGDKIYVCPDIFFAERFAEKGNKVYFYFFDHRPSNNEFAPWMGVTHLSEVQFVFGLPLLLPMNYTREEVELSSYMVKKWSNFAKTGQPGNEWPLYTAKESQVLRINIPEKQLYKTDPEPTNCDVYRPYFGFEKLET